PRHLCRFLSALLPPLFYPLTPPPPTHRLSLHDALPIYRERARQSSPENPRAESIQEAIHHLKQRGLGRDEVIELLRNLDIQPTQDRKSTRLNSSHVKISYAVFCLKKKKNTVIPATSLTS